MSLLTVSREDYNVMVAELLGEPAQFEKLCEIACKTLSPWMKARCKGDRLLRNGQYESDIMQELYIKLMVNAVSGFLLRDGTEKCREKTPEQFVAWMYTVASNCFIDFRKKVSRHTVISTDEEDFELPELSEDTETEEVSDARAALLQSSFTEVLESDSAVYKVLTWLALSLFVLETETTKIAATRAMLKKFEDATLDEMYSFVCERSSLIPWLTVTDEQHARIRSALDKKRTERLTYGQSRYSDFFMKVKGEPSGKKSVSDWLNRLNGIVLRGLIGPDATVEEKDAADEKNKKERPASSGSRKKEKKEPVIGGDKNNEPSDD